MVEAHERVALAAVCAARRARGLCDCAPPAVRARRAAAAGREEAVLTRLARGGEVGGVHAVAGHAGAVCKRGGGGRRGVFEGGARRALAVAALGREEAVRTRAARVGELVRRVRRPGGAPAAWGAQAVVELGGAGQRELAGGARRRQHGQHGAGGAVVVGGALHAGVLGLAGEAALAEGAGGAGQAEAIVCYVCMRALDS